MKSNSQETSDQAGLTQAKGPPRNTVRFNVCKQHLDVCLGTLQQRLANDANGWGELTAKLKAGEVDLVVLEATGGYERGLVCALQGAGMWLCTRRLQAGGFEWPRNARSPLSQTSCRFPDLHGSTTTHEPKPTLQRIPRASAEQGQTARHA